jgi:ABC-type multidrug transport system fused ATPase/permease subunit
MRTGASTPAWREARAVLRRHRGSLALALVLVVTNRTAALALPTASKYVVDEVIARHRVDLLAPVALLVCGAIAVETATAFGASQLGGVAGQRAVTELRRKLQEHALGLPLRRIEATPSGALAAHVMNDSEQVRYLVGTGLVHLVSSALTSVLALGMLFWLNAPLALAVLAILIVLCAGVRRGFGKISATLGYVAHLRAGLSGRLAETIAGVRIVKACAAERGEAHRFAQHAHRLLRESIRALRGISLLNGGSTLAVGIIGVLVLIGGGRGVASGTMSLGSLVMFVSLAGFLLSPVIQIAAAAGDVGNATAALSRIAEFRGFASEDREDGPLTRLPSIVGSLECEDVSYAYVPGQPVLRGVTFRAAAGSMTALVGPNGSGKSTLCSLLLGYDRPTAGRILIDGHDLATLQRRDYRRRIGIVLQEPVLIDGTIADNICYGRSGVSLSELQAAARLAHCQEFIARLPEGYSTLVGERGACLSAGQRQRIAIARALLGDPRILILDEATSSLDFESETLFREVLQSLRRERTTFVVAHRLSTVQTADQILVLDQGAVVELGTQEELLAGEGRYWRLYQTHQTAHDPVAEWSGAQARLPWFRTAIREVRHG